MNNARAFNPFLCARTDKLKKLIAEVQKQVEGYETFHKTRKRARRAADQVTFAHTIEAIICDLCAVEVGLKNDSIHLPLSNQILRSKSRYKGTALGKTLPDILKVMSAPEMSFVEVEKGHSKFEVIDDDLNTAPLGGRQTVLQAGHKLQSRIERFAITKADLGHATDEEVVILREPKRHSGSLAPYLEYKDNQTTTVMREQMACINAWLAQADITCDLPLSNDQDRRLRRIFNNADFGQGGRLYGGFWQKMSSEQRLMHILIDDDGCVECDYGQMSLMLLYSLSGKTPPEGDLYDLSQQGIPTQHRKGIKKVMQSLINSEQIPTRMPKGARKHLPKRYSMSHVLEAVTDRHPAIYPHMTSNIGMQLFRKEADILVEVLLALRAEGIVALPVHDAVIVNADHEQTTARIMKQVFKKHTGLTPSVS
jgi:hypothetical protein